MWYTEGIIKMQKCVIGGYLQIQQKSGALVLSSQQAGFLFPNLLDLKLTSGARMMITDG